MEALGEASCACLQTQKRRKKSVGKIIKNEDGGRVIRPASTTERCCLVGATSSLSEIGILIRRPPSLSATPEFAPAMAPVQPAGADTEVAGVLLTRPKRKWHQYLVMF